MFVVLLLVLCLLFFDVPCSIGVYKILEYTKVGWSSEIPSSPILMILVHVFIHAVCMRYIYLNLFIWGSLKQTQKRKGSIKSGWISVTSCDITPKHPWVTLESTLQFTTKQFNFLKHYQIYSDLCMLIFVIQVILISHDILVVTLLAVCVWISFLLPS